jgi:hypothetical protein
MPGLQDRLYVGVAVVCWVNALLPQLAPGYGSHQRC